ncbi:unnamed protein product [Rotaria sp. Silwood2]|nr:unnamed protein product [Rotaria sp. Silwood2]
MDLNKTDNSSYNDTGYQMLISSSIVFWTYLILDISSTICSFFLLYQFISRRILHRAINNHTIIAITFSSLGTNLLDVPFSITYAHLCIVWPPTPIVCVIWWFASNANFATTNILIAWGSFERHILIFHEKWLSTKKKRWLIHYAPLIFFMLYPFIFYVAAVFIPSCNDSFIFDYTQPVCGWMPCYASQIPIVMYDISTHGILPNIVIAICSIALLIRVVWHKHIRYRQQVKWKKYRKLTIQMLSLSIVFLIFNLPYLIYVILEYGNILPTNIDPEIYNYLIILTDFCILLLPFITLLSLPSEFWLKKWRHRLASIMRINTVFPSQTVPLAIMLHRRTQ